VVDIDEEASRYVRVDGTYVEVAFASRDVTGKRSVGVVGVGTVLLTIVESEGEDEADAFAEPSCRI